MIAITNEEKYLAKIAGEKITTPEPVLRKEQYLSAIANGEGTIPELPITREEQYLAIIAGENYAIPTPETRLERYMAKACGLDIDTPTPITNVEYYWAIIAEGESWDIITITGSLPLSFLSKGEALTNYLLHGSSEGAGEQTKNSFDKDNLNIVKAYISSNDIIVSYNKNGLIYVPVATGETYTILGFKRVSSAIVIKWGITTAIPSNGVSFTRTGLLNQSSSVTVTITSGEAYLCIFLCGDSDYNQYGSVEQAIMKNTEIGMIMLDSTAPDHYIPYGYQIPLALTSGQNTDTYPLYIGSTQLGAEEYVDYQEQKIWKMVDGTLTPTDPPVPLPEILTYQGENTLSSTETLGEVEITGKIKEAVPNG